MICRGVAVAEIAEPLTGPARANPLLRDPVLFDMYMRALDEVLDDRELSVAFNEFGLSAAKLRRAMVMGARRVLGAVSREFAAYERTLDRQLDVADAARAAGEPRPLGELSGALRPLAVATGAAGALVAVAGVAGMVAWPRAEPLVWAGGTMLVVAALLYASLRLLRTNFGLRLLRDDLILGVNPDLVVARDRLMAAVSQTELLSQVRMFVNTARRGRFGHTFSVTASPGLSEVYDRTYSVPTGIATELDELLGRLDGASIGVAGPRGCGKSTLIRRYCDDGGRVQTRPEKFSWNMLLSPDLPNNSRGDLRCHVAAPVDYVPRDFVLHMFAVFCRAVIGRYGRKPGATDRLARGLYWLRRKGWLVVSLLLRTSFYAGPGVVLLYWTHAIAKQISVPSSRVRYAAIGVISVGILSFARSSVKTVRLWGRVAGPGGNKALAVTARRHLARVRYLQTHTSGWSGALRHPGGSRAQRSGSTSRAEQPLSYPEIVDEFRTFAREVAADVHRNGDRVFIGIDELDKIGSAEQAEHFLNEIKGIFGIPHLYFVVSVSDDALTAFDRRGLPLRDAFDSSFDEIIHVGPLGYGESRRLLYRRNRTYRAIRGALLLSRGRSRPRPHSRCSPCSAHRCGPDLGLTANKSSSLALDTGVFGLDVSFSYLLLRGETASQPSTLGAISAAIVREELRRKVRAVTHVVSNVAPGQAAELQDTLYEITRRLALGEPAIKIVDLVAKAGQHEPSAVAGLRLDFAAYAYYCATLQEVFTDCLGNEQMIEATSASAQPGSFDSLAAARYAFTLDTQLAWRSITQFRQAWFLEIREPVRP